MPLLGARATASRGYFGGGTKPGAPVITSSTQGVASLSIAFNAPVFNGGLLISKYEYAVSTNNSTWTTFATATSGTNPPTSPVTISGLTNGQAYYVKLRAVNGLGFGPESNTWSTTTTPRTTPDAPTLDSVTRGYRSLTIAFTAPAFNGGSEILDYEYSTNSGSTWASMGQSGTADYAITGLADFTEYSVRVRAVNIAGGGAHSATVSAYTAGVTNAPISLAASSNGVFQSVLTWTAPDSNASAITDYVVQYSTSSTFASSVTTFSDGVTATTGATVTSLAAAATYYFRVASVNAVGQSGWSSIVSAATAGVPAQVGTPSSSSGDKSFTISWTAPSDGGSAITGYRFQRSSNGGASWDSEDTTTGTSKTWTNVANGTSYVGRVQAYNAVGDGAYSAASTARTPTFAAPGISANGSYASTGEPGVRRVSWAVDPTDIVGSTSSSGTTTYVYVQWTHDASGNAVSFPEELVATYTGNAYNSGYGTSFTNSGTVLQSEQYRVRAEQTDGVHTVGTAWVNVQIVATQNAPYNDWAYTNGVNLYTTGTFNVNGGSFFQVSASSIPGTNGTAVGDTQYTLTSFIITATGASSSSASTSTRYFRVQHSGTDTNLPPVSETSTNSNTWSGAGNNSMEYTWNITNIGYGNAGAGRVAVDGLGVSSWSPNINVVIVARGNKRTMTTYNFYY